MDEGSSRAKDLKYSPGFHSELEYWDRELSLQGDYPEAILRRLLPERTVEEFPPLLYPLIEEMAQRHGRRPRVLDVGSGPLSMLAYGAHQGLIELVAADPLANEYRRLLLKHGYEPTSKLVQCFGEELSAVFGTEAFDIVWIHNALDHSQSPELVLAETVSVLRPGGFLVFQGWSREGTAQSWVGLHQHDIYLEPGGRLTCETRQPDGSIWVRCINEDLPLEPVMVSDPTPEVKQWLRMVWRKLLPSVK